MTFEHEDKPAFVPNGDDVQQTAVTLVTLADKHGIPQTDIQVANDGFYVSDRLADLLYEGDDETTVGEVAEALAPAETADYDPAGTIAADRAQIALAQGLAKTNETATIDDAVETVTVQAIEGDEVSGAAPDVHYEDWEYAALKTEIETRGLETENKKTETYIAALRADDIAKVDDPSRPANEVE